MWQVALARPGGPGQARLPWPPTVGGFLVAGRSLIKPPRVSSHLCVTCQTLGWQLRLDLLLETRWSSPVGRKGKIHCLTLKINHAKKWICDGKKRLIMSKGQTALTVYARWHCTDMLRRQPQSLLLT